MEGSAGAEGGTLVVDLNTLMQLIDTRLGRDPKPKECQRIFYMLSNVLSQLSGGKRMPLESDFWDPSIFLPNGMRNAVTLFDLERVNYAPTTFHDLLETVSCGSTSKSSPGEDNHPL